MITLRQIKLLANAVDEAEAWRGSMVGCAPQEALDEFDANIAAMRAAVKEARKDRDLIRSLEKQLAAIKLGSNIRDNY